MKNIYSKKKDLSGGYSIVEIVFYVAILSLFFIIIINSIISFTRPYRQILALRLVERSGLEAMERITRDIRYANTIDTGNSTLDSHPGVLTISSTYNSVSTTTKFYLDSGVIKVDVNGAYSGPLTTGKTTVTSLIFRRLIGTLSEAVRVEMEVSATVGSVTKTKKYYSTTILKGID